MYSCLKYDPNNEFVIDLDNVWKWLGFGQKVNAKQVLEKILLSIKIINYSFASWQSKQQTLKEVTIKK